MRQLGVQYCWARAGRSVTSLLAAPVDSWRLTEDGHAERPRGPVEETAPNAAPTSRRIPWSARVTIHSKDKDAAQEILRRASALATH
jgi:hypothetical protein